MKTTLSTFLLTLLLIFSIHFSGFSQCIPSTISETITATNTIINGYYPGVGTATVGSTTLQVEAQLGTVAPIADGDLLLVIQMQSATINYSINDDGGTDTQSNNEFPAKPNKQNLYGDGAGGQNRRGFIVDAEYLAGQYEYIVAAGAVTGGNLPVRTTLQNRYVTNLTPSITTGNFGTGIGVRTFQVIRVANYNSLTINGGASVTSIPWNGRAGGIVAIDVNNTLTLNGTITTDSQGFRGGYRRANFSSEHSLGWRGEGIAGRPGQMWNGTSSVVVDALGVPKTGGGINETGVSGYPGGVDGPYSPPNSGGDKRFYSDRGNGAPGNAGGAGREDASGGGGSNYGNGGDGGAPSGNPRFASVGAVSPRFIDGSYGDGTRLMLGGGGGSGGVDNDNNDNNNAASGHPGGGIVIVRAKETVGNGTIDVDGGNGGTQTQEGAGGGGAGGTIFLLSETEDISNFTIYARGGQGSNSSATNADAGGGGGGGGLVIAIYIGVDAANFSNTAAFFPEDPEPLPNPITATTKLFLRGGEAGLTGAGTTPPSGGTGGVSTLTLPPDDFICDETLLPITLLSFDGERTQTNEVKIWWQTANELDNKEFWIERSIDAGQTFQTVAKVAGKGTVYQTTGYEWIDKESSNLLSYYRLRQVDYSGKSSITHAIKINSLSFDFGNELTIIPNPSKSKTVTIYHSGLKQGGQLQVIDMLGRVVKTVEIAAYTNSEKLELNLSTNLPSGTYIIQFGNNNGNWQEKLIIE